MLLLTLILNKMKDQLIKFYLDYTNNYLTVTKMALDYDLTIYDCQVLINMGRQLHESRIYWLNQL